MKPTSTIIVALLATLISPVLVTPTLAQDIAASIRIEGVPERLVLPLVPGQNQVVTAVIRGEARHVWLSWQEESRLQVALSPAGDGRYQVNLADPAVKTLIDSRREARHFRFFARLADGGLLASIPVAFARRGEPVTAPECVLIGAPSEEPRRLVLPGPHWVDPADLRRIELRFQEGIPAPDARLVVGNSVWMATRDDSEVALLPVPDDLRRQWIEKGQLSVQHRSGALWTVTATLRPRPRSLPFGGSSLSMRVHQRHTRNVPDTHGYLRIALDDITGGRVHLTLHQGGEPVVTRSVQRGDTVTFELPDETYCVYVRRLINQLLGSDWAELDITRVAPSVIPRIHALIDVVAASNVHFVREDREFTPRRAAEHLRHKLALATEAPKSVDDFIERIASRSSVTDRPYRIRLTDGSMVDAAPWLEERAQELEASQVEPR